MWRTRKNGINVAYLSEWFKAGVHPKFDRKFELLFSLDFASLAIKV